MKLILHGTPNSRQREFFLSRARHTAYGGARGGGKSWAMRRKFVLLALRYPELNLLLLRRTLPELRENHIIPLQRELYGIAPYNSTERVFQVPQRVANQTRLLRHGAGCLSISGTGICNHRHGRSNAFYGRTNAVFDDLQPHDTNGYFAAHVLYMQPRQRRPCMGEAVVYRQTVSAG